MTTPLSPQHIATAARVVDPAFLHTPQFTDAGLSERLGRDVTLKLETLNPVRSFKGRGADFFMRDLAAGQQVVCASAGNFGQAIAYAGRARGVKVTVFAAVTANPAKVARMRALGAEVVLTGRDFDAAKVAAVAYAENRRDLVYVEDGRHPRIAEGAGTIAVELERLRVDTVVVPVGNGALITGIGCWFKEHSPTTRVVGVCAAGAPCMADSWSRRRPIDGDRADTIADGIAVRVSIPEAVDWMTTYVDDVLLVDDGHIMTALGMLRDTVGMLLEPAGAVAIAALVAHEIPGKAVAAVLTGSNFSPALAAELSA